MDNLNEGYPYVSEMFPDTVLPGTSGNNMNANVASHITNYVTHWETKGLLNNTCTSAPILSSYLKWYM